MQKTQQTTFAEYVINLVWDFMKHARGNFSINDIFTPTLAILYAFHKGYRIRVTERHYIDFVNYDDRLYCDLINFVPFDKHLHYELCRLVEQLGKIDVSDFNSVYVEVLSGLFERVSCSAGRASGEFFTPKAITKLMAYIVEKENCKTVFDPFCGTASIVHEIAQKGESPIFTGHELNFRAFMFARLNVEALYGHDECIKNFDSIVKWEENSYDAVVSCPPFGMRLSPDQLNMARHTTPESPCRSYEEIILMRPFYCNLAKLTITHLPTGFCFRGNRDYELRRKLVEYNVVDTVISLPENILYGTSIPSILLICKTGRKQDEPIKFIHAENYFVGERNKRTFDYDRFIEMIEGDACDITEVSVENVRLCDFNLTPSLYEKFDLNLKEGQSIVTLGEILTPVNGERIPSTEVESYISPSNLSREFISVLLNNGKYSVISEERRNINYRHFNASEDKYLLTISEAVNSRYGIHTSDNEFVCHSTINVYKVNQAIVTPEYLVYTLLHNKAISKGRMSLRDCLSMPLVIDSLETQKELVNKKVQQYNQKVESERQADAKRLGIKQNVSDLEHMLGTPQDKIYDIISRLERISPSDPSYLSVVKSLKDNVEYLNRLIEFSNTNISTMSFNIKECNLENLLNEYVNSWRNYGGNYFAVSLVNNCNEDFSITLDERFMTVMLDAILNNAVRHGFNKNRKYTENNLVEICTSLTMYKEKPYVLIQISNNGEPFNESFTVEDYISRGRYSSSTGRSGLGGYHVYQVIKGHNGFLRLDSNKQWNTIIEILLPVESSSNINNIYEYECI